ncbi:2-hydroxymuconate tautomerase family protein [uncultured Thiothrix sp.]|uniref:tautomerase family protein n=1 Tax=uncultured Thiothrix sp. TaxID=223185 RepID=UPI002626FC47|nr:2-hydroxymuconate tautomerase family protein [uncultured Thiothrix sp.]
MPLIQATILQGRTVEQKNEFFARVTQVAVETLNVKPEQVRVVINEVAPEHWCIGGLSKAEIDKRAAETS